MTAKHDWATTATGVRRLVGMVFVEQSRRIVGATLLNSAYQALDVLVPVLVGLVVDQVLDARGAVAVAVTLVVLLAVFGVRSMSYRFGFRLAQQAQVASGERLRHVIMRRLLYRDGDGWRAARPGVIASVVNVDTLRISLLGFALPQAISTVPAFVIASVFLMHISPLLGAATVSSGLLGFVVLTLAARRISAAAGEDRAANATETALAEDICRGMRVLRGVGGAVPVADRYREVSTRARDAAIRLGRTDAGHHGLGGAVGGVMAAVGIGVGAWFVVRGDATIGELVTVTGLLQFLQSSLATFGWVVSQASLALPSVAKVVETVGGLPDEPVPPANDHEPRRPKAVVVEFDDVSIAEVTGLCCRLRPGEVVGLVGTDHRVVTELFECLEGRRAVRAGRIVVGDVDLAVARESLWRPPGAGVVAVVDSEAAVLADTFADDLELFGCPPDAVADYVAATLTADVLPGLSARAEYAGVQTAQVVSGGERQRLALLRALVARPAVLAMRDATTALDPASERHVMHSLARLRADGVTLVATTSPIALAATTRVFVLDGPGPPVEGTHRELCHGARYREIVWGDRW